MLKRIASFGVLALLSTSSFSQINKPTFYLTDFGFGFGGQGIPRDDDAFYNPFIEQIAAADPHPVPFRYTDGPYEHFPPGKLYQVQISFTQLTRCCVAPRAKSIRLSLGYARTKFLPYAIREIEIDSTFYRSDHMSRSMMHGIRGEGSVRRLFTGEEEELRGFVGIGIMFEYTFNHTSTINTTARERIPSEDSAARGQSLDLKARYNEWTASRVVNFTGDHLMMGAYLTAGVYWLLMKGVALEVEFKAGRQTRTFERPGVIHQNFLSGTACTRVLLRNGRRRK